MINDYDDFKHCMRTSKPDGVEELVFLKKRKPYTFSEYYKKYQKEKKENTDMNKRR